MWRRPIAVAASTATIIALVVLGPTARANGPGEPMYGDLDGDGVLDRARLGATGRSCAVLVEPGRPEGGYLPQRSHAYRIPGGGPPAACPDLGVAVDLDAIPPPAPGPAELVLGWYDGNPGRSAHDLLVLRDYRVAVALPALPRPNFIGLADFDGDRRQDVYLWTDQGDGFATYLNTGAGTLVPGPVRYCAGLVDYQLTDFDHDRASDVVIAYVDRCADGARGVTVLFGDGSVVDLLRAADDRSSWTIHLLDADHNGLPDVLTYHQPSGQPRTFLCAENGTFLPSPLASRDVATVDVEGSVRIPVLANDWVSRRARIGVLVPPAHGAVEVTENRTIAYRPNPTAGLTDRFVYRITQDGRTSDAAVMIKIVP